MNGNPERDEAVDVAQLSGRAALRGLLRCQRATVEQAVGEMRALAAATAAAGLPFYLRLRCERLTGDRKRHRLGWQWRGASAAASFDAVRAQFDSIPAPLRGWLERCQVRARELNAIEVVCRHAAYQIESYLKCGAIKGRGNASPDWSEA